MDIVGDAKEVGRVETEGRVVLEDNVDEVSAGAGVEV